MMHETNASPAPGADLARPENKTTTDGFSSRLAGLSVEQKILLMKRLQERKGSDSGSRIKRRASQSNVVPLSFAQQRLWFLHQLEPDVTYNLPFALRLRGPLHIARLERCVNEIVARHEILRTTFTEVDERSVQIIAPELKLTIPVIDLRHLDMPEQEAEARRLVTQDAARAFDLSRGPLLSCTVLRLTTDEFVLMLAMHHIITDGWSIGLFVHELTLLYEAFGRGETPELSPLPLQYADFVEWQHRWLKGEVLDREMNYWKQHMAGAPHRLHLPTDYPRPPVRSFRGARHSLLLSRPETDALRELARQEEATLFMTLLAVYKVLLHHLARCDDIVIGCLIANRNHLDTENLIGFFVNQLVLRTKFSDDQTFRELLGRLRQVTLDSFDHQDLPYQWLVDALHVERDLSCNPLFQVNFTFQNTPITALNIGDLKIEGVALNDESLSLDVDLSLLVSESPEGLQIVMRYSLDLFSTATIKRMLRQIEMIIRLVIKEPNVTLGGLTSHLSTFEKQHAELQLKERKEHNMGKLDDIRRRRKATASSPPAAPSTETEQA